MARNSKTKPKVGETLNYGPRMVDGEWQNEDGTKARLIDQGFTAERNEDRDIEIKIGIPYEGGSFTLNREQRMELAMFLLEGEMLQVDF